MEPSYAERRAATPGVVVWEAVASGGPARILPDGCLDLIWDGESLFVAGPDSSARWHQRRPGTRYAALRFAGGTGPALLGVPADELLDRVVPLASLWPAREAAALADLMPERPAAALHEWAVRQASDRAADPLGPAVLRMSRAGLPVAVVASRLGLSARQLHRRCLPVFGYGPALLRRVLRMNRALAAATAGAALADAAAASGYADQAHLCRDAAELAGTTPAALLRERGLR